MIDFASLFWFAAYGAAFITIGIALRQIARWSGDASTAEPFGGYGDLPWPHGVQEEEPVRWDVTRLRRRGNACRELDTQDARQRLAPLSPRLETEGNTSPRTGR